MAEGFFGPGSQSHPTRMRSHPMASFSICRHNELEPQPEHLAAKAQDCTRLHTCKSRSSDYIRIPSSLGDSLYWLSLAVFCRLTFDPCFASSAHFHVIWWDGRDATAAQQNRRILKVHRAHPTKIVRGRISAVPRVGEKGQKAQREDQPFW